VTNASSGVVSVIMNEGSGSSDSSQLRKAIEASFARHDRRVTIVTLPSPPTPQAVEQRVRQAEGTVVVAGGDGTVNAVASACRRLGRPFGIIAAGTFNYVARNLGLPTEVEEAVKVIVSGTPSPVAAGEINGHLFLNNAGFGLYSHIIEQRELDKRRFGRHRLVAFYSGLRVLSHHSPLYKIQIEADGLEHSLRTTTLFFGVNALQLQNYNVDAAKCVERGRLALLSLRLDSRWDIAGAAWAALRGKTESANAVGATCASTVRVATRRKSLKVALDGEILVLKPPLVVRYVADALQIVMLPREATQAEGAAAAGDAAIDSASPVDLDPTASRDASQPA